MTPLVCLTPLSPADGSLFYTLGSDPEVARFMRFDPLTHPIQGEELALQYTAGGNLAWRVSHEVTGETVGIAALKLGDHGDPCRSVSLFLARSAWGLGYGTSTMLALQEKAKELHFFTLAAFILSRNTTSRRLVESCGFHLDEILTLPGYPDDLLLYHWEAESQD